MNKRGMGCAYERSSVLSKSQAYLDTFARFRSVPAVVSAER